MTIFNLILLKTPNPIGYYKLSHAQKIHFMMKIEMSYTQMAYYRKVQEVSRNA